VAINYRDADATEQLTAATKLLGAINVWFETLRTPNPEATFPLLARRGRYVLMAGRDARPEFPVGPFYVNDLRAMGFAMFNASPDEQRVCAEDINRYLKQGQLKPLIGARFSLADAAAAHQMQEDNTLAGAGTLSGKIVLRPGE
jgi:NADPH2:quinone reductase